MSAIIAKAGDYRKTANDKAYCHFEMSEAAAHQNLRLGLIATILSTIVGTTIFAAIAKHGENVHDTTATTIQIVTGLMSVTAAVLAALQTFFRLGDVSAQNKSAAVGYEKIKLSLDLFLLTYDPASIETGKALDELKAIALDLEKVEDSSPSIPDSVYHKIVKKK
jgi:uncharacterized membrane protein